MARTASLYKVLEVREQEKDQAQLNRVQAVEQFEQIAQQLYEQLKAKETAEERLANKMKEAFTIDKMIVQSRYIDNLSNKIITLQHHVQQARVKMEQAQELLNEAHIEVKKIEKMIEIREAELAEERELAEAALMDEMSMRQYNKQFEK